MRGQLYREHINATALSSSLVVSALGSESDNPGSSPGRGKASCSWDVREKNLNLYIMISWILNAILVVLTYDLLEDKCWHEWRHHYQHFVFCYQ